MPDEDVEEKTREIAQKSTDKQMGEPAVDVCDSPAEAGPVPIPYPNFDRAGDTSSGSKQVKISGKEVGTKGSSYKESTGDEAGQSNGKSLIQVLKKGSRYKIVGIPVWMLGVGLIVLLVILYVATSSNLIPIEPIDEPIHRILKWLCSVRL